MGMKLYEMRLTYGINADGHPVVGFKEEGETHLTTKLGMLRLAEDTLLNTLDEEGQDDD